MAESSLQKKLGVKAGHRVLVIGAPEGYLEMLGEVPGGVPVDTEPQGAYDCIQVFVRNKADIDDSAGSALGALKPGGLLWFAYPKKSSKVKTDINRDQGWDVLAGAGWACIAQISIDDTWSAGRFRPLADINSRSKGG